MQKRREYENRVEVTFSERYTSLKDELSKENEEMSTGISQITEIYEVFEYNELVLTNHQY